MPEPTLPRSSNAPSARLGALVTTLALVAYGVGFLWLYPTIAAGAIALYVLPLVAGGWFFGWRGGLAVGLLSAPIDTLLLNAVGVPGPFALFTVEASTAVPATALMGAIFGWVQDLRLRVREQAAAIEAERDRSRMLIEGANALVVGLDDAGRVTFFNRGAEETTGYRREEVVGRDWFSVLCPRERYPDVWARFESLPRGGIPATFENPILTRGGEERVVAWRNSVLREDGVPVGTLSFGIDVTERVRLEREAARQRETLSRQERFSALGTLVAGVAHEINNPLAYVKANVELALEDVREADERLSARGDAIDLAPARAGLESALEGGARIARITRALRAVARPAAGERGRVDLAEVVEDVADLVRAGTPPRVRTTFSAEPVMVLGNAGELHQVLLNLVKNAIEALDGFDGAVDVSCARRGDVAEVRVKDDGPGIPSDVRARLFDPFFTTKAQGTGLGLSIVHAIVTGHGGEIVVESEAGNGAVFTVSLPLAPDESA